MGIAVYFLPMFIRNKYLAMVAKPVGISLMALGVVLFIAWDVILAKLTGTEKTSNEQKELEKKYKRGEISLKDYSKEANRLLDLELEKSKKILELERRKQVINKKQKEIKKVRESLKPKRENILGGDQKGKLGSMINLEGLGGFMSSSQPQQKETVDFRSERNKLSLERQRLKNEQLRQRLNKNKQTKNKNQWEGLF